MTTTETTAATIDAAPARGRRRPMIPVYHSAPVTTCSAPAATFRRPLEALQHARNAADAWRVGYCVYEVLAGRLKRLAAYSPNPARA